MRRILFPAILTFVAGLAFGFAGGRRYAGPETAPLEPDLLAWEEGLVDSLGLDREQHADLRVLLSYYARERRRLLAARRREMEPEFDSLDFRFEGLIRDHILDPGQRRRAAELASPVAALPAGPPGR